MSSEGRLWVRRLRWRLRGGLQWPTFAVMTVADGLLLHFLPPVSSGVEVIPGIIIASFANLFLVGAVAPWLARRMVAERSAREAAAAPAPGEPPSANGHGAAATGPSAPPYEVLLDRAATGLLVAGALGLLAAGLASRPLIVSETEATELNARVVRDYTLAHAEPEYQRNIDAANTIRISEGYFRTCVPANDRRRAWCLFVDTNRSPPEVREDTSVTPNDKYLGGGAG
jgi:hypothetical protein